jgi:hypothetical protein
MSKQTAVDWLWNELKACNVNIASDLVAQFNQAKQMEKEQIIYAYYFARLVDQEKAGIEAREYFGKIYGDKT